MAEETQKWIPHIYLYPYGSQWINKKVKKGDKIKNIDFCQTKVNKIKSITINLIEKCDEKDFFEIQHQYELNKSWFLFKIIESIEKDSITKEINNFFDKLIDKSFLSKEEAKTLSFHAMCFFIVPRS